MISTISSSTLWRPAFFGIKRTPKKPPIVMIAISFCAGLYMHLHRIETRAKIDQRNAKMSPNFDSGESICGCLYINIRGGETRA